MAEFTFKNGPVMPERTWRCADARVEGPEGKTLNLRDVTTGHFLYTPGKIGIAQFALFSASDSIELQCNARAGSSSHAAFEGFVKAVLLELERHNPAVTFTPPPNDYKIRRVGQLFGVAGLLYGIYFVVVNGLLADEAAGLGFGLGFGILALSAFWIWALAPGSRDPKSVAETKEWVLRAYGAVF